MKFFSFLIALTTATAGLAIAQPKMTASAPGDTIYMADPTIYSEKGMYYLYGTGSPEGFLVYQSKDLKNWSAPVGATRGHALIKGDSYGTKGFWAPQIFKVGKVYYMAYTADEHIAIAQSDSPLGPFKQKELKAVSDVGRQIDPFIFKDTDGKYYLYHVRLTQGNRIFVTRMKDDLSDDMPETAVECITATMPWEDTQKVKWTVTEGPTVIKKDKLYYLFYSANDFRNPDYAVGYATSTSPVGPWKKYEGSPIISRANIKQNGTGHGDLFTDNKGQLRYVFHVHKSDTKVAPRATAIVNAKFVKDASGVYQLSVDPASVQMLTMGK